MQRQWMVLFSLLPILGCSAQTYKVAPVSGRVTLDGKPLAKAHVHFAPLRSGDNIEPGPTSQGETDADGRYTLSLDNNRSPGAVVGKHKVYIITVDTQVSAGELADAGVKPKRREILPARYNQETTLTFDVPAGGSDAGNFDLKSK